MPSAPNPAELLARKVGLALVQGRADLAREPLALLMRALPKDETVRLLSLQAAIIGFDWPLDRQELQPRERTPPDPAQVDLVAFHASLAANPSGLHKGVDYFQVLRLSFESGALRAPQARRLLITDEATQVPADLPVHEVLRYPMDLGRLMYERMRAQVRYLEERDPGRVSVLLDSDVVVNAEPTALFTREFDVGLSWRPEYADAPFNGGMIAVAEGKAGLAFFRRALACYDALADDPGLRATFGRDLHAWWGDQFALALMVGYRAFAERRTDVLRVEEARVRFLPCDDYNFTLEPARHYEPAFLRRKAFVHFKGNRKDMQAQYLAMMRAGTI